MADSGGVIRSVDDALEVLRRDAELRSLYRDILLSTNLMRKKRRVDDTGDIHVDFGSDGSCGGSTDSSDEEEAVAVMVANRAAAKKSRLAEEKKVAACRRGRTLPSSSKSVASGEVEHARSGVKPLYRSSMLNAVCVGKKVMVSIDMVDKRYYCCGMKASSKPTMCACRYIAFSSYGFVTMLVVLDQIRMLKKGVNDGYPVSRVRELFNSTFGVTNVIMLNLNSNAGCGLFYHFHYMKACGTFCCHAMHVLLGAET